MGLQFLYVPYLEKMSFVSLKEKTLWAPLTTPFDESSIFVEEPPCLVKVLFNTLGALAHWSKCYIVENKVKAIYTK